MHKSIATAVIIFLLSPVTAMAEESAGEIPWYQQTSISGGITAAIQGTSGNNDSASAKSDDTHYSFTLDLNIESELAPGHMVFIAIESGDGEGANNKVNSNTAPNYDPYNTHNVDVGHQDATISQAFYEGTFSGGALVIDIGKMDIHSFVDQNEIAGDETAQFMAGIFNRLAGTLYPELDSYYAPGIIFTIAPSETFEITIGAANSNNDNVGRRAYGEAQLNMKPGFLGRDGNYRVYYIIDNRDYTKISDSKNSDNWGLGVSFDQMISDTTGLFFRYGSQDDDLNENTLEKAIAAGFTISGSSWNRGDDLFGVGYGMTEKNGKITTSYTGDQKIIELFYRWQVFSKVGLTADVQFHSDMPRDSNRDVAIFGLRGQLDF